MLRILIANPKGGTGKSTLATHLAAWFAWSEQRVMLGDLDLQQSSRRWLERRRADLPAIGRWEVGEDKIARPPKGTQVMVLDSPAGLRGKALKRALAAVDTVVIPVAPSVFDQWAVQDFYDELLEVKAVRREEIAIGAVGMRVNSRTQAAAELEDHLRRQGLPMIARLRQTQMYVQTLRQGMTLFDLRGALAERDREEWRPLLDWIRRPR